jgi:1,2-phenylacetyl-CoA epoxidase catalytic subunit
MGLSASQARLLSITARLTDNEYHSQQIANAKTRLAAKGTEAREEYQRALNSSVLIYNGFDNQGNATSTVLTPNVIYQYQPLKNQYALINTANQILVSNVDATNFEETNTLGEFLQRYGLL